MNDVSLKESPPHENKKVWLFSNSHDPVEKELILAGKTYFALKGFPLLDALIFFFVGIPLFLLACAVGVAILLLACAVPVAILLLACAVGIMLFLILVVVMLAILVQFF